MRDQHGLIETIDCGFFPKARRSLSELKCGRHHRHHAQQQRVHADIRFSAQFPSLTERSPLQFSDFRHLVSLELAAAGFRKWFARHLLVQDGIGFNLPSFGAPWSILFGLDDIFIQVSSVLPYLRNWFGEQIFHSSCRSVEVLPRFSCGVHSARKLACFSLLVPIACPDLLLGRRTQSVSYIRPLLSVSPVCCLLRPCYHGFFAANEYFRHLGRCITR